MTKYEKISYSNSNIVYIRHANNVNNYFGRKMTEIDERIQKLEEELAEMRKTLVTFALTIGILLAAIIILL